MTLILFRSILPFWLLAVGVSALSSQNPAVQHSCSTARKLIKNPGFETGNLDHWNFDEAYEPDNTNATVTVVSPGLNSKYAARMTNYQGPHDHGEDSALSLNSMPFELCRGVHYKVTMSFNQVPHKTFGDDGYYLSATMDAFVYNFKSNHPIYELAGADFERNLSTSGAFPGTAPAGTWVTVSSHFVAKRTEQAGFSIVIYNGDSSGIELEVDNIQVSAVKD